jgi:hypothetical protein
MFVTQQVKERFVTQRAAASFEDGLVFDAVTTIIPWRQTPPRIL